MMANMMYKKHCAVPLFLLPERGTLDFLVSMLPFPAFGGSWGPKNLGGGGGMFLGDSGGPLDSSKALLPLSELGCN